MILRPILDPAVRFAFEDKDTSEKYIYFRVAALVQMCLESRVTAFSKILDKIPWKGCWQAPHTPSEGLLAI